MVGHPNYIKHQSINAITIPHGVRRQFVRAGQTILGDMIWNWWRGM